MAKLDTGEDRLNLDVPGLASYALGFSKGVVESAKPSIARIEEEERKNYELPPDNDTKENLFTGHGTISNRLHPTATTQFTEMNHFIKEEKVDLNQLNTENDENKYDSADEIENIPFEKNQGE